MCPKIKFNLPSKPSSLLQLGMGEQRKITVLGKMPLGKMLPGKLPPENKPPRKIIPRKNAPQENCPLPPTSP